MEKKGNLADILFKTAIRIMKVMEVETCGIWLIDEKGALIPRVSRGIKREFTDILVSEKQLNALGPISDRGTPFQLYELSKYCSRKFRNYLKEEGLKSLLACPIFIKGRKTGMIVICTKKKYRIFTETEKLLFFAIAKEIAFILGSKDLEERVRKEYLNTIKTIANILDSNDKYTYGHSNKVMKYAIGIWRGLKLKKVKLQLLKDAALLHDIGKIGIDRRILNKKGKLTAHEWEEIKKHPSIGAEIVGQTGFLDDMVPIIKYHHARFNEGGYPDLEYEDGGIPLGARIIAIADAYDAMTSARPYREEPLTPEMALAEIEKNAGTQFDPELAEIFVRYMAKEEKVIDIPVGTALRTA